MTRIAKCWKEEADRAQMRFPQADAAEKLDRVQFRSDLDQMIGAGVRVVAIAVLLPICVALIWWLV